jgi:hypothetical protein
MTAAPLGLMRRDWLRSLLVFVAAALLLLLADVALLWGHSGVYRVAVGNYRDKYFLTDTHRQEITEDGATYRWTRERSTLWLTQFGPSAHALLTLELGGRPEPADVQLSINGRPWTRITADTQPRAFHLALPPDLPEHVQIDIQSPTFTAPGDPRELGIKVEGFALTLPRATPPLPVPAQYAAQLGLILALQLAALRLGWDWRRQALLATLVAIALALALSNLRLVTYAYLPRLAVGGAALALLTWIVLPLAERLAQPPHRWFADVGEVRLLWMITLLACAIRLTGVMFTTFASQDTGLNLDRVYRVMFGQLIIIKSSFEFANGDTLHPPGVYLGLLPGTLLIPDFGALMHGFTAILDGMTCFLVAMLTRKLGGNREAALLAAVLYLAGYSAYSILVYGFQKHIFGQWFTTPLALLLLSAATPPRPRDWLLATVALLFGVVSHIGAALLNFTWFACIGLLMLIAYRGINRSWLWGAGCTIAAALLALGLLYVDVVGTTITHTSNTVAQQGESAWLPGADPLILKGLRLGYTDVGVALLPLGLLLIARARSQLRQVIVPIAWVLVVLIFLVVDLVLAMQTRYFFFALPLALAAFAIVLGKLAIRGQLACYAIWSLVLLVAIQNTLLWFSATFGDGKFSMTPLTH